MPGDEKQECFHDLHSACRAMQPLKTAAVHPVQPHVLEAVADAAKESLIQPVLIGPRARISQAAAEAQVDIADWQLIETEHSHAAATTAVDLAVQAKVGAIMKGSLHTSELLGEVVKSPGLRTERRISHIYLVHVPTYPKALLMTDTAVNIAPDLQTKADICCNAIDLWRILYGYDKKPKVAILAAVETVSPKMQATLDAAALCKMADRGQIANAILDGPLAFDNAISAEAAKEKGIVSPVSGDPDILLTPNIEAANIVAKQLIFLGGAHAAGLILGARVPIILTSRADSRNTRMLSCVLAFHMAMARKEGHIK